MSSQLVNWVKPASLRCCCPEHHSVKRVDKVERRGMEWLGLVQTHMPYLSTEAPLDWLSYFFTFEATRTVPTQSCRIWRWLQHGLGLRHSTAHTHVWSQAYSRHLTALSPLYLARMHGTVRYCSAWRHSIDQSQGCLFFSSAVLHCNLMSVLSVHWSLSFWWCGQVD